MAPEGPDRDEDRDEPDGDEVGREQPPADGEDAGSASGGDGEAAGTVEEREAVAKDEDELFG